MIKLALLIVLTGLNLSCASKKWERYPIIEIRELFSAPARLQRGSVANQAYLDFESWLNELEEAPPVVGLSFGEDLNAWSFLDITHQLWEKGCRQITFRIRFGDWHSIALSRTRDGDPIIAMPIGASLAELRVINEFYFGHGRDIFLGEQKMDLKIGRVLSQAELERKIKYSGRDNPLFLYLDTSYSLLDLDQRLTELEALGATWFTLIFLHS